MYGVREIIDDKEISLCYYFFSSGTLFLMSPLMFRRQLFDASFLMGILLSEDMMELHCYGGLSWKKPFDKAFYLISTAF